MEQGISIMAKIEDLALECKAADADHISDLKEQLQEALEEYYQELYPEEIRELFVRQTMLENVPKGAVKALTTDEEGRILEFEMRKEWEEKNPGKPLPQHFINKCYGTGPFLQ